MAEQFQSPKSGQICLNIANTTWQYECHMSFQSPKSGQICLN